ncbi:MBL fold metallo-hydrolase, partial [Mycobacterium tuberculosis]
ASRCGAAWSPLVPPRPSGRRLFLPARAGFVRGALAGSRAAAASLRVGPLGLPPPSSLLASWPAPVRPVGVRRVLLLPWAAFFRPLSPPLRALPSAAAALALSLRLLAALAAPAGVALPLPPVWRRAAPWLCRALALAP